MMLVWKSEWRDSNCGQADKWQLTIPKSGFPAGAAYLACYGRSPEWMVSASARAKPATPLHNPAASVATARPSCILARFSEEA